MGVRVYVGGEGGVAAEWVRIGKKKRFVRIRHVYM